MSAAHPDDVRSRRSFLDLIPELRNTIYQILIDDDHPTKLLPLNEGFKLVAIDSPMLLVNKQISAEFSSLAIGKVPMVETQVHDLRDDSRNE